MYSASDPKCLYCYITQPYAVFTDFASWQFPHDDLPPWWPSIDPCLYAGIRRSKTSLAVKAQDLSCQVMGSTEAGTTTHVVLVKEQRWFLNERMYEYSDDGRSVKYAGDQLLLRLDRQRTQEQFNWVVSPNGSQYVYYDLGSPELVSLYHQSRLRSIGGVESDHLLTAYACAILPTLRKLLGTRTDRYLLLVGEGNDERLRIEKPGDWCAEQFCPPLRPGSASPDKMGSPSKEGSPDKRPRNEAANHSMRQSQMIYHYSIFSGAIEMLIAHQMLPTSQEPPALQSSALQSRPHRALPPWYRLPHHPLPHHHHFFHHRSRSGSIFGWIFLFIDAPYKAQSYGLD